MNEFKLIASVAIITFVCMGTWCATKELFSRWVNNDWCRHSWGMWETKEENKSQLRFCKKCNMMERRHP